MGFMSGWTFAVGMRCQTEVGPGSGMRPSEDLVGSCEPLKSPSHVSHSGFCLAKDIVDEDCVFHLHWASSEVDAS